MKYFLYIKTHTETNMKYLGYTSSKNPHSYKGSGKYWIRHIEKYGNKTTTEILLETENLQEIKEKGLYYSNLWDIVDSEEWANLKPETGQGGFPKESFFKKYGVNCPSQVPEFLEKQILTFKKVIQKKKEEGFHWGSTSESAKEREIKLLEKLGKEDYHNLKSSCGAMCKGSIRTEEQKKNHVIGAQKRLSDPTFSLRLSEACKGKREIVVCPHCGKSGGGGNMRRYHFDKCKNKYTETLR